MYSRLYLIILSFHFCLFTSAQLRYPVVGTYQQKSAQGMAIWRDSVYIFNDGGNCRVMNLISGRLIREFKLESYNKNTHVNTACFSSFYSKELGYPIIYIGEYYMPSRCFVEGIKDKNSVLLQTIEFQKEGIPQFVHGWIVDDRSKSLYAITRSDSQKGKSQSGGVRIWRFHLPKLRDMPHIVLSDTDSIESFTVYFDNGIQGSKIRGKYLYISTGLDEMSHDKFDSQRAIQIIDLKKKKLVKTIDLTCVTVNEPEDIDFYHGKCLLFCGQNGGIYEVKL